MLSGFSLATGDPFRGGFWAYVRRRARRILPPYYAALALPPADLARTGTSHQGDPRWGEMALPAFVADDRLPLLLIHNVRR